MENFKKAFEKKPAEDVHDPKKNLNWWKHTFKVQH
jgi:hypothetical protein